MDFRTTVDAGRQDGHGPAGARRRGRGTRRRQAAAGAGDGGRLQLPDDGRADGRGVLRAAGRRAPGGGGLAAGQEVDVRIELDTAPRETPLPDDLDAALDDDAPHLLLGLAPSHRKEWVRWVEEAKKPETRAARIEKTAAALREGKKAR